MMRYLLRSLFPVVMMAGDGGGDDPWHTTLPEDVQAWDEVKNSDSPEKFWKQVTDMRSHLGQSIRIPGENASEGDHKAFNEKLLSKVPGLIPTPDIQSEDSVNAFYNRIGRPEKSDGYTIPKVDDKGVKLDDTPIKDFQPIAHKHGLSDAQFQGIVKDMTETNVAQAVQAHTKMQEQQTALKNEWGLAFENNMKKIANVATNTGAPEQLVKAVQAGQVDLGTAKWLLGVANSFKAEGTNLGDDKSADSLIAPSQAKIEIADIMNNKEHAYWDKTKAGHAEAKTYLASLYKMAYPGDAPGGTHAGAGTQ